MIGRLILKILPWWAFALFALMFTPLTIAMGQDYLQSRADVVAAHAAAPPDLISISELDAANNKAPLNEVYLSGTLRSDVGPWERHQKGVNFSYLIVQSGADYVLLHFPSYQTGSTQEQLSDAIGVDGMVKVNGFIMARNSSLPPKDWLESAVPNGHLRAVIEPYFGARDAAIDDVGVDNLMIACIAAFFNVVMAGIAVVKFRKWRQRKGAMAAVQSAQKADSRPTPPVGSSLPRAKAKSSDTATRPKDGFSDGPIQSPKGWFK